MKDVTLRAAVLATLVLGLPLAAAQTTTVPQPGGRHDGRLDEGDLRAGEHLSESIRAPSQPPVPASSRSPGADGSTATPSSTTETSPTTGATSTTHAPAVSTPSPSDDKPACRMLPGKTVTRRSIPLPSREAALNHVRVGASGACPGADRAGTLGKITCTSKFEPSISGNPEGRSSRTSSQTTYTCSARVTCPPVEHCESKSSGASAQ